MLIGVRPPWLMQSRTLNLFAVFFYEENVYTTGVIQQLNIELKSAKT